jgi:cytochrome c oxidase subunit IV
MSAHAHDATPGTAHEHDHPSEREYIRIAAILTAITVAEVAIYYVGSLRDILVPALIIMSVVKFLFVVMYFMHLKVDDKRLAWTFGLAMFLSVSVVGALVILQRTAAITYASDFLTGGH